MKTQLYSVEELSEILNLHSKTIQRFIREGKIKGTKIGRTWKVHENDLKAYAHSELTDVPKLNDEVHYSLKPGENRIQVSAVVEIKEKQPEEASRLSNSLMAMLNCKDPAWGHCDYRLIHYPETGTARFILNGSPHFIGEIMSFFQVILEQEDEDGRL